MSIVAQAWTELTRLRDEVRVQAHLFNMESKENWEEVEKKFSKFNQSFVHTLDAVDLSKEELSISQHLLLAQLRDSYKRIKSTLT